MNDWDLLEKRNSNSPKTERIKIQEEAKRIRYLKSFDSTEFNSQVEELFYRLVVDMVRQGPLKLGDLQAEAAYILDVSIETAKRYIIKWSAQSGPLLIRDKHITLKVQNVKTTTQKTPIAKRNSNSGSK